MNGNLALDGAGCFASAPDPQSTLDCGRKCGPLRGQPGVGSIKISHMVLAPNVSSSAQVRGASEEEAPHTCLWRGQ